MADPLYIAQLVIYLIFLQPAIYCLWKHGRHGFLGWFYLQLFCAVRVIGAAVIIHEKSSTGAAAIILGSIGLSPLLLSNAGILHEARACRNPRTNRKLEWLAAIQYHMLVSLCLVMVIIAIVKLEEGKTTHTTQILLKVGISLVIISWAVLVLWTTISWTSHKGDRLATGYADGTKLLLAISIVLPLIAVRVVYGAISLILEVDDSKSGFPSSRTAKVVMSVVPEMILTAVLIAVGILTRDIKKSSSRLVHAEQRRNEEVFPMNSKPEDQVAT